MATPPEDLETVRNRMRDPGMLLTEMKARVTTLLKFRAIKAETTPPPHAIEHARRYTETILTAYHELLRDAEYLIVPKERWDRLTGRTDDDWDE